MKKLNLISNPELESIKTRVSFEYFSGKRILITGGAGMLGSWLATSIVLSTPRDGSSKTIVDMVSRRSNPINLGQILESSNCSYIQGDVTSIKLKEYDLVIHAASAASPANFESLELMHSVNSGPMPRLIKSSPNLDQFIFISSGEVYGKTAPLMVDEAFEHTALDSSKRAVYPEAKLEAESELNNLANIHSFAPGIIRLFHSFGPGVSLTDGRSFADFIWSAAKNETIKLYTDGSQTRSILYLEDAVVGILNVISKRFNKPVNVGSNIPITINQLAHTISQIAHLRTPVISNSDNYTPSPNTTLVPSNKLLQSLGWEQEIDLENCINRTLHWCESILQY